MSIVFKIFMWGTLVATHNETAVFVQYTTTYEEPGLMKLDYGNWFTFQHPKQLPKHKFKRATLNF